MITLYPAIDLQEGRAVRLVRGDFDSATVFNEDPVAQAQAFAEQGATSLHVVDLDGAQGGEPVHAPVIAAIAAAFPGEVHLGGGLRSRATIETALATGVHRVVLGTAAIKDADLLKWAIGRLADRVVVAIDARDGMVATHGWTKVSDRSAVDLATDLVRSGVRHLLYTDIGRDGTLEGPNFRALRALAEAAPPLNIIMSGGVGTADDLRALRALKLPNLKGVIVGRALYDGRFTVPQALAILTAEGTEAAR
jgi:phosphoribosylformimino-5-aminoimidazole carboxamide ribotide isomerase